MTTDEIKALLEGPETLDLLTFHLRNMADTAFSDQIDADRASRAANVIEALKARVAELEAGYADAVAGLDYVRYHYGELHGVGFERVRDKFDAILVKPAPTSEGPQS